MQPVFAHIKKLNTDGVPCAPSKTLFHEAGNKKAKVSFLVPNPQLKGFLSGASDWKIRYDEDTKQKNFPQHIAATPLRPDVVIFSQTSKRVLIMELTCGNKENVSNQHQRKSKKYSDLFR